MKLYDIKIVQQGSDGKNHWHTIGKVFAGDDGRLERTELQRTANGDEEITKPVGFVINYPPASGIIVPSKKKDDAGSDETPI